MGWIPSWLQKGAHAVGTGLSHVPGLGGIESAMEPGASNWDAFKLAGIGGLEAGLGTLGGIGAAGVALPSFTLPGMGAAGEVAEGAASRGLASQLLGKAGGLVPKSLIGKGALGLGAYGVIKNAFGGKGGASDENLSAAGQYLGMTPEEMTGAQKAIQGLVPLVGQDGAIQIVLGDKIKALTAPPPPDPAQLAAVATMAQQFLNPYVSQVRRAAASQAQALQGLVPNLPKSYAPLLNSYITSERSASQQGAAQQAMGAMLPTLVSQMGAVGGGQGMAAQLAQAITGASAGR